MPPGGTPAAVPGPGFAWRAGPIDAYTDDDGTLLRLMPDGGALSVRHGRLQRAQGYAETARADRQFLARVGAIIRLRARGRFHVHAAGVADPAGRGWLLAGENGAGKSTLAYALTRAGWKLLGDDGVIIEREADGMVAHAWREPLAVSRALASEFPELAGREPPPGYSDARDRVPMRAAIAQRAHVAALVFLERGDRDRVVPVGSAQALAQLVRQSSWVLMPDGHAEAHLEALRELAEHTPRFLLTHTSHQLHHVADTLTRCLA